MSDGHADAGPSPVPASPVPAAPSPAAETAEAISPAAEAAAAPAAATPDAPDTAAPPPPAAPYPGFLPSASLRFAHAPELLLFALDLSREAALPATRNPEPHASSSSSSARASNRAAPVPARFNALASVALLVARAKAALLPPSRGRQHHHHRFGLLACRGSRAAYVRGSICAEPWALEAALSRLREEALDGADESNAPFDFTSLADAAAEAAHDGPSPSFVRVVLLYTRSRAPAPLPLSRERALDALWRARSALPSLHVDVLYAYDPSSASSSTASDGVTTATTTTPQQVFSRLEACVDALSATAPHALFSASSSSTAALDAAKRNHGYVLDVSVFAPRRLLGAACQLVSHPLQRPALARPPPPRDLAKARSVPLPSEAGSRKAAREQEERRQRELDQQLQQQGDQEEEDGRDEWGLPLPPPTTTAATTEAAAAAIPPPLLVDITDQMQRVSVVDVSSFPVMASGHETDGEGSGLGEDAGGQLSPVVAAAAPQQQQPTVVSPPPPPPPAPPAL